MENVSRSFGSRIPPAVALGARPNDFTLPPDIPHLCCRGSRDDVRFNL